VTVEADEPALRNHPFALSLSKGLHPPDPVRPEVSKGPPRGFDKLSPNGILRGGAAP